jgi:alpha-galactosidase
MRGNLQLRRSLFARAALCLAWLTVFAAVVIASARGEAQASVATADVRVQLDGGTAEPRLLMLRGSGQRPWRNSVAEALPAYVEQAGKRLPLQWQLRPDLCRVSSHRAVFVYDSLRPHLRLRWEWTARARFGPVEHRIVVENLSGAEYWLPVIDSLRLQWQVDGRTRLEHFYVEKPAGGPTPIGTHRVELAPGYRWTGWSTTFAHPVAGRSREIIPYEAVFSPGQGQAGWYAGIEFSGRTRIALGRSPDGVGSVLGLDPEPGLVLTRLVAGGSFATPTVFLGAFAGGPDGAGNQLRPWVRAVLGSPRTWRNPEYPLTVNNSWGAGMAVDESIVQGMIADASGLGLEMFHLDAGWFRGVGDWYPDPRKFPQGLAAVADDAHRHGMRFGLWVDWSQAGLDRAPGALNLRDPKVQDWLVADVGPDWKPQAFKGQTIDLGVPAARRYAERETDRIVTDDHLDMLEHDGYLVTQGCTRADHPHAPPDTSHLLVEHYDGEDIVLSANSTDVSDHAVQAYYGIQERLRREHPGLLLEICNDGGRMIDFGSAAHGDYFSISDTYDPLANRRAFYDVSFVLPAAMLEDYVMQWPAPRIENFLYMLRSGMMGWISIMQDTREWTAEQHAAARTAIALYKSRLRPLIRDAEIFHVSARPDGVHWDGIEYWDRVRGVGVVFAFHGSATDEPQHRFVLAGLERSARYRLHFEDGSAPDEVLSGAELMNAGVTVKLPVPLSSELVLLTRQ